MADEQVIYLSPEEELTNVRERLEGTPSRRIILVVPAQTQLRSHLSWRLLHIRSRELKKDILIIIGADRQMRAVVKAAGFKVADPLESPPTSKRRPASRPVLPGLGGKTFPRPRIPTVKAAPDQTDQMAKRQPVRPSYVPDKRPGFDDKVPGKEEDDTPLQRQTQPPAGFDIDSQPGAESQGTDDQPTYPDDESTIQLPEQRGSASINDVEDKFSAISDFPTDVIRIEDQGDMGDSLDRSTATPTLMATPGAAEDMADIDDDDELPPVPEPQPGTAFITPAALQAGGQAFSTANAGTRSPEPAELPQRRQQARHVQSPLKKRTSTSPIRRQGTPARTFRQACGPQPVAKGWSMDNAGNFVAGALLVLLALLALVVAAILLPSADVTVLLPVQTFTLQMKLTANSTSHQDSVQHTLPAQTLVYDASVQGTGKATGVTMVGTVAADGGVYFTNNNTPAQGQIDIPTGTTVATQNHVLFTTQADVLVQPGQTLLTTIQAQSPGVSGNVAANTITVLPAEGISKIQQANPGVAINLKVNNTDPTAHGGSGTASLVTSHDVTNIKNVLDTQARAQMQSSLQKNVHQGDVQGSVVHSETLTGIPAVGDVAPNGIFLAMLKVHTTVLVVRAANLQAAATAEMKNALSKQGPGLALAPQQAVQVRQLKNTAAGDGNSLVLSLIALGQVAAPITEDTVRNVMAGKSIDYAGSVLHGQNGTPNVLRTDISVQHGLFRLMPFLPQRITVHFQTVPVSTSPPQSMGSVLPIPQHTTLSEPPRRWRNVRYLYSYESMLHRA